MCECIKMLRVKRYVDQNLLSADQYFLSATKIDSRQNVVWDKKQPLLLINYCPVCGEKISMSAEDKQNNKEDKH